MISIDAVKAVYHKSLKLKPHERCLIVTDTIKESIGRVFYEYVCGITEQAHIEVMDPTKEHAAEPPNSVAKIMLDHDVELLITEKSLTHTLARRQATARGARIATMPSVTEEIINRCMDIDYEKLKQRSTWLYNILKKTSEVRVVTEKGTDIFFKTGSSEFFGTNGGSFESPGDYGNLPEGEVAFAPSTSSGTYVVDASFPGLGILNSPIIFKVEDGMVRSIEGNYADKIIERLDLAGEKAYQVAELGIGLNPKAKITGNILEDEKVIGTVHVAVGNNLSFGGNNDVALHLDGVINKPDIYVDDVPLMKNGQFQKL